MIDLWLVIGFFVISLVGGAITGALALFLGGAGSLRVLAKRLETLEGRQDDQADTLMREVKKRASAKGVEARRTIKEAEDEADAILTAENPSLPLYGHPGGHTRPSVIRR